MSPVLSDSVVRVVVAGFERMLGSWGLAHAVLVLSLALSVCLVACADLGFGWVWGMRALFFACFVRSFVRVVEVWLRVQGGLTIPPRDWL